MKGFVAKKDESSMEANTIEYFNRQGRKGLELAVFTANEKFIEKDRIDIQKYCQHTWVPRLWVPLVSVIDGDSCLEYRVLDTGMVELEGKLLSVRVEFTFNIPEYGEGESSSAIVEDIPSYAHTESLASCHMVLTRFGVRVGATFPQAPECPIGTGYIPSFHTFIKTCRRFHAYLVMPMEAAICASEESQWPTLLVQGDLQTNVQKMGCFKLSPVFVTYAKQVLINKPFITVLEKLIIR